MIKATLKIQGFKIDKPVFHTIMLDENALAFERRVEGQNKPQQITVGQLFDLWYKQSDYVQSDIDTEDQITYRWFTDWFSAKYLTDHQTGLPNKFGQRVLDIQYEKI